MAEWKTDRIGFLDFLFSIHTLVSLGFWGKEGSRYGSISHILAQERGSKRFLRGTGAMEESGGQGTF